MKRRVNRRERIADLIQQSLAESLLKRMRDERFQRVTVTGVEIARDLSFAKVCVSVLAEEAEVKPIIIALNHAAKILRHYLSQDIELRIVPELRFDYDDSVARGSKISSLISDSISKDKKNNE